MRKPFIAAVLVMGWALVASASAQTPATTAAPAAAEVSGTVVSTGNIMMFVRGDDGQDRSLVFFNTTQMPDERIAAGERVKVRYRPIDGERFEAVSIERFEAQTAPAASTGAGQAAAADSAAVSWPAVATVSSLAWLVLALGVTVFVAAYLVSVRRHHHHHMH
jgi:hypothetical protein